jgi:hypothetical protein
MRNLKIFTALAVLSACAGSALAAITSVTWTINNSTRTHVYTRGTPITVDTANVVGPMAALPNGCGTTPALPAGLSISQLTTTACIISGTPTATSPTTLYHVHFRAANGADSITFMTITVGPVTNLNYGTSVITGTVGRVLTAVTPTLGLSTGTMVYSSDSALPSGLTLASATGIIAGTPTAAFAGRTYVITATNGTDTTRATVRIEAKAAVSYTAWSGRKTISVNTTGLGLASAVTNFPVLVRLTGGNADVFAASKTGADVRFTAADSVTPLAHQIERWDSTAKKAEVWVTLPSVAATGTTSFIMHYGMAGQTTTSSGPATFSTHNGFQAVWHMNAATAATVEADATANAYNATPTGTTLTTGVIGPARAFDGQSYLTAMGTADSKLNFPHSSAWTITAWATSTQQLQKSLVTKSNNQYALQTAYDGDPRWENVEFLNILQPGTTTVLRGGWPHAFSTAADLKTGWQHVVAVSKAAGLYTYVDGVLVGTNLYGAGFNANGTTARSTTTDVTIGGMFETATFSRGWDANIDNVTMSNVARDSNFIRLSYATQRPTGAIVTVPGTVATVPDAPTGVNATLSAGTSAIVTWSAPANDGGAAITLYKAYAVNDTAKSCTTTGALTCTVTGLTGSNTFVVRATNSVGRSAASAASGTVVGLQGGAVIASASPAFSVSQRDGGLVFALPQGVQAGRILVSDLRGRQVWSMNVSGTAASWNGILANGKPMSNGVYMVRFTGQDAKTWESRLAYTR